MRRGLPFKKIALVSIIAAAVLFAPIPYYQSEDAVCLMGNCAKKGWYLNGSLWDGIVWMIKSPNSTMQKSIPIPLPENSHDKETFCQSDNDCGLNICACKAMRKEYIRPASKACTRVCEGKIRCINNQCVLQGASIP